MWQRPDQYLDPDPDATVEFPAVTGDEPPGWRVHGEQSADGWVTIEIIELAEGELEQTPQVSREVPRPRDGGERQGT